MRDSSRKVVARQGQTDLSAKALVKTCSIEPLNNGGQLCGLAQGAQPLLGDSQAHICIPA